MPTNIRMDYDLVRRVAEIASGYRYQDVWVVVELDPDTKTTVIKVYDTEQECTPDRIVFPVSRVIYGSGPRMDVAVVGSGATTVNLLDLPIPDEPQPHLVGTHAADAVFWSKSAVEKFLVPYYSSVYGDHADAIVRELLSLFRPLGDQGPEENQVFALAHLPSSEYVTLDAVPGLFKIRRNGLVEPFRTQAVSEES